MPAVAPLIMAGASYVGGKLAERSAASAKKKAEMRSPEEQQIFTDQAGQARQLFSTGMPGIQAALKHYGTLLGGSRSARLAEAAPEMEDVADAYAGSEKAIDNRLRGGEREQAVAENSRQRAGQIARLVTGKRAEGAAGVAGLSQPLVGMSGQMNQGLLGNSLANREMGNKYGTRAGEATGEGIGALFAQFANLYGKGKGAKFGGAPGGYRPVTPFQIPGVNF